MEYRDWNQTLRNTHPPRNTVEIERQGRHACIKMPAIADENQYRRVLGELEPALSNPNVTLICRSADMTLSMAALLSTVKKKMEASGRRLKIAWQRDRASGGAWAQRRLPRHPSVSSR